MKKHLGKNHHILLLSFFIIAAVSQVFGQYPTDSAKVSLLTLSPGSETYAAFGHSAIHVLDRKQGIDYVYNYGTFDFSTPNFYPKFASGRLMYCLSASYYTDFFAAYQSWGQAMWEQKLNLTNKEKWQLIKNLQINYQQENRYYRYAFFRDNCSTRIRDIIEKSVDGRIVYDSGYIEKTKSYRQLYSACLDYREPWALFGIDFLMGKETDSIAGLRGCMFLPKNLMNLFTSAVITSNSSIRMLSDAPVELYPSALVFPKPNPLAGPVVIFWALFIIVAGLTYLERKKNWNIKLFDAILFTVSGLLGLLILILMVFSLHVELWSNYNIIWANPVNLIFAITVFMKNKPRWIINLIRGYGLLLIIFIPLALLKVQVVSAPTYPLVGILLVRIAGILYTNK